MWASLISNLRDAFRRPEEPLHLESRPAENDLILHEEGTFSSLWSSVRDVFFPPKLPPLVLESKPIPLIDHLILEVTKLLRKDLSTWPLPVQDLDLETGRKFAPLLMPDSRRPDPKVFEEAIKVARWELQRELDASADYFRNQRWRERELPDEARTEILFISRWLEEQLLSLREYTQNRVTRAQLVRVLDNL